ncbi:MAG: ImmA/IrrE family metallo-endopeptidase [Phycisphaerae bacterium]|nr:ImmA/IrrE family metallo-endopeptidase [Phycisphaerae bacterium]MDD5380536.1 ImmA/IrrE family metallo-endopeptidase [Phycisphaerae bacterium]
MNNFKANYLEIEPRELVRYLLIESGQESREALNPAKIIDLLKLNLMVLDFNSIFSSQLTLTGEKPRAMLSFHDRLIASDNELSEKRMRFSVCHEIAHYVLPNHQHSLYLCDNKGLSFSTQLILEKEANEFAIDLLLMGNNFTLESNSQKISAETVKQLGEKYKVSFEAIARRLVEKNFKHCMLVVFEKEAGRSRIDPDIEQNWQVRYCIASPPFKTQYFTQVRGKAPPDVVAQLSTSNIGITDSIHKEISIKPYKFDAEFFTNKYNIFGFFVPVQI